MRVLHKPDKNAPWSGKLPEVNAARCALVWKNEVALLYCPCEIKPFVTSSCKFLLQDVALVDNHPDDENQHERITDIVYKGPGEQTLNAADQSAECVVEGMSCHCNGIIPPALQ